MLKMKVGVYASIALAFLLHVLLALFQKGVGFSVTFTMDLSLCPLSSNSGKGGKDERDDFFFKWS